MKPIRVNEMDGIERYTGLSTNELALVTIVKLEGLEKKVGESFDQFKCEITEVRRDATEAKTSAEKLDSRVTTLEATKTTTMWAIGGMGGLIVILLGILFTHALGGF
jgi:hypothetical protein